MFYATIAKLWNLPYIDEIPGTINAIATLLGIWVGVSSVNYNKNLAQVKKLNGQEE